MLSLKVCCCVFVFVLCPAAFAVLKHSTLTFQFLGSKT